MPLKVANPWTIQHDVLTCTDPSFLLLELQLDHFGWMLNDGGDPGTLTRAVLAKESFEEVEGEGQENVFPKGSDVLVGAERWSIGSVNGERVEHLVIREVSEQKGGRVRT